MNICSIDLLLFLITFFWYILFLVGVGFLYLEQIKRYHMKIKMKNRLKARRKALKTETKIEQHLHRILSASMKKPMEPKKFIQFITVLFFMIVIVGIQNVSLLSAFSMAILISAMPYLLLRVRLETQRRKGSYEGERLISEFLSQYRICGFNIYKTMENVVIISEGMKISSKLLFKLLLELRNTGNSKLIKEATDRFAYSINTNWSRMLGNNIRIAAERGTNVSLALEDILIQLREARVMSEERKRLNSEAVRIVIFLVPLMYLGTVFMTIKYLGLSVHKFLENQLYTSQGFLLFLFIVFLFMVNLALIEIVNNQRFDY